MAISVTLRNQVTSISQRRCAFLTMDNTAGWSIDADLAIRPMEALGWRIDNVPWRSAGIQWQDYDAVYIGTPWDYPDDPALFLQTLSRIDGAGPVLVNPLSLVRWNLEKTYLRDLEARGVTIVPTVWLEELTDPAIDSLFARCGSDELIVKPAVSTNATDTFPFSPQALTPGLRLTLARTFTARPCLVQPFIPAIRDEGEYSLFYIGNGFSHAIQKRPKPGDFRVQEEHGARIDAVEPEARLLAAAERVIATVQPKPMYARADFVRGTHGAFLLMELELIEPSLYLRMHPAAPERFAGAFDRYVANARSMASD